MVVNERGQRFVHPGLLGLADLREARSLCSLVPSMRRASTTTTRVHGSRMRGGGYRVA